MYDISINITKKFPFSLELLLNNYYINLQSINIWNSVSEVFSDFYINDIRIQINWDEIIPIMQRHLKNEEDIEESFNLDFIVTFKTDKEKSSASFRLANYYVENALYHIFSILNFAVPGSLSYFSIKLLEEEKDRIYQLSSSFMVAAWELSLEDQFLDIRPLNLQQTFDWYQSFQVGYRQIAKTNTERALFATINFLIANSPTPANMIWLAHALESLYDSPKYNISKTLIGRIITFLDIPEKHHSLIKKIIKDFYKLRSEFVHGEIAISLPSMNDILEEEIMDYTERVTNISESVLAIIIATIQKMIINNWSKIEFSTVQTFNWVSTPDNNISTKTTSLIQ